MGWFATGWGRELGVVLVKSVHHQLCVVVDVGFLGIEHAQRPTKTLAHRFLGELGLENVLEASASSSGVMVNKSDW